MLRVHGIAVIGADNGVEAYEIAVRERPDAVVTELALPLLDGSRLCSRIRRIAGLERVPVIAWTGWMDARGRHGVAADAGFTGVVMKAGQADIVREILSFVRTQRAAG